MVSTDIYNFGTYNLKIKGEIVPYASKTFIVKVKVNKLCDDLFMNKFTPGDQYFSLFVDPPIISVFSEW